MSDRIRIAPGFRQDSAEVGVSRDQHTLSGTDERQHGLTVGSADIHVPDADHVVTGLSQAPGKAPREVIYTVWATRFVESAGSAPGGEQGGFP